MRFPRATFVRFSPLFWGLLLLWALTANSAHAEDDDAELALEPPDAASEDLDEELQQKLDEAEAAEVEGFDRATAEGNPDADVTELDEGSADTMDNDRASVLQYHRSYLADKDTGPASGEEDPPHTFHLGVGAIIPGEGSTGGAVDFQFALGQHVTFGPLVTFSRGTFAAGSNVGGERFVGGQVSSLGAIAAFNFYTRMPYEGLWVQAGTGMEYFRAGGSFFSDPTISATVPLVLGLGWRWLGTNNLTFAFNGGLNAYLFASSPKVNLNLKLVLGLAWNVFPH